MNAINAIREKAVALLKTDAAGAASEAAGLLKTAADIEQQLANTLKLDADRKKVERDLIDSHHSLKKDMLVAATPLVTTAILAGTLVFQIYQAREQAKEARSADAEKREELTRQAQQAEQVRFTDALKLIQTSEKISPAAMLLNTFTAEPQRSAARQMVLKLMVRAKSESDFEDLFSGNIEPITYADLPILIQLNRSITSRYMPLAIVNSTTHLIDTSSFDTQKKDDFDLLVSEIQFTSQKIGFLLERPRPTTSELDLSNTSLSGIKIRGANLRNADISGISMTSVELDGSDLSDIKKFQNSYFYYTAWWRVSRIGKPLLTYLMEHSPYQKGDPYPDALSVTNDDYLTNVTRLESTATE
jgi:Pentapeptide repeats (8 copies)